MDTIHVAFHYNPQDPIIYPHTLIDFTTNTLREAHARTPSGVWSCPVGKADAGNLL